jgi:hypothetical protein
MRRHALFAILVVLCATTAFGQQSGSVTGKVSTADGDPLPGVTATATSTVLPQPRTATTSAAGEYRLPLLPPGDYQISFALEGMSTETRPVAVLLDQNLVVDVTLGPEAVTEQLEVVGTALSIDPTSAELKAALDDDVIESLPVGQEYRDVQKLIPGVQYTEDNIRGPSAGGSGQDNVYKFDGVNVGLPLFGVLSAEPSAHDLDQVAVVKGGAKAIDFNRSGGFTINSVSKSGTDRYLGALGYQIQDKDLSADRRTGVGVTVFEDDKDWLLASFGGPVLRERLFFYGSYYRPTKERANSSNVYGTVPNFEETRDEFFGKLSYQPTDAILLHGSYRDSDRENDFASIGGTEAPTASLGEAATLGIAIVEGSWLINDKSFATFKHTDFDNDTSSLPDNFFGFPVAIDGTASLDVANLDRQGYFRVPTAVAGNAFIANLIQRYGFLRNGVRTGGGVVGGGLQKTEADYARQSYEAGYDWFFGDRITHELHFGYQWSEDEEVLLRQSNGWGDISARSNTTVAGVPQPVFFTARVLRFGVSSGGSAPVDPIRSAYESQNFEINDTLRWNNWTFSAGVLASNDTLFGQDLRQNGSTISGYELAIGNRYEMYELDWQDMLQPRLGAIWAYNGRDTAYVNLARYVPAASSLPRAASWARNNVGLAYDVHFDAAGRFLAAVPVASSSGKLFQDDLDPRTTDEYVLGTSRQINPRWTARAHARYRYSYNFWEDTNNTARVAFNPPEGIPRTPYIPDLTAKLTQIGSGSTYVIAELDGAFTKYYEAGLEAEWRGRNAFARGSYVWSHYYGNFDQDNTTTDNDASVFIGSSFVADGAGRQLWNFRYGDLRGDRRHQLKVYGYYRLPWNASTGAFAIYQSGQPWEVWNVDVYRSLTSSTDDTSRLAEPAGSRSNPDHYQVDLNYTQDFPFAGRFNLQLRGDVFNVTNNQTGYNIQNKVHTAGFGQPRAFFEPRRIQLAVRLEF